MEALKMGRSRGLEVASALRGRGSGGIGREEALGVGRPGEIGGALAVKMAISCGIEAGRA